ncbi:MAG: flagellar hook-length control protein FliK [Acidobacteria bacterium]|nr:flagellar hook-length control protein FliK [Acidobacteriota bacterium]
MEDKKETGKEFKESQTVPEELASKKKLKHLDRETSLSDLSSLFSLRARTLEKPGGSSEVSAVGKLPKKVIDEVVQAVRVGVNRAGDKEVQFDLKSDVMDGMRVRVSMHEGKVMTVLEITTLEAKNLLESNLGELRHALMQKGLDVAQVNVQFKEQPPQGRQEGSSQQQRDQEQQPEDDEYPET